MIQFDEWGEPILDEVKMKVSNEEVYEKKGLLKLNLKGVYKTNGDYYLVEKDTLLELLDKDKNEEFSVLKNKLNEISRIVGNIYSQKMLVSKKATGKRVETKIDRIRKCQELKKMGKSAEEIAKVVGISESSVYRLLKEKEQKRTLNDYLGIAR